jgi:hypothetical protein
VSDFDEFGSALDQPLRRPSVGSRFGDLSDRLARTFGSFDRSIPEIQLEHPGGDPPESSWEPEVPRFPFARHGYDPTAVDRHLAELEQELADSRERATPSGVTAEIERIGTQTAAILRTAHEQAHETTHQAQAQADSCIADAAANAVSITAEANQKLRELDSETDLVWRERARLIDDVRSVAGALLALADDAADRFPSEPEKVGAMAPEASEPTPEPEPAREPVLADEPGPADDPSGDEALSVSDEAPSMGDEPELEPNGSIAAARLTAKRDALT